MGFTPPQEQIINCFAVNSTAIYLMVELINQQVWRYSMMGDILGIDWQNAQIIAQILGIKIDAELMRKLNYLSVNTL